MTRLMQNMTYNIEMALNGYQTGTIIRGFTYLYDPYMRQFIIYNKDNQLVGVEEEIKENGVRAAVVRGAMLMLQRREITSEEFSEVYSKYK